MKFSSKSTSGAVDPLGLKASQRGLAVRPRHADIEIILRKLGGGHVYRPVRLVILSRDGDVLGPECRTLGARNRPPARADEVEYTIGTTERGVGRLLPRLDR